MIVVEITVGVPGGKNNHLKNERSFYYLDLANACQLTFAGSQRSKTLSLDPLLS